MALVFLLRFPFATIGARGFFSTACLHQTNPTAQNAANQHPIVSVLKLGMAAAVARTAYLNHLLRVVVIRRSLKPPCSSGGVNISLSLSQPQPQFQSQPQRSSYSTTVRQSVPPPPPSPSRSSSSIWANQPDYRKWKDKEAEMLNDVEPIISLAKDILHSSRYKDGDQLTDEDKKAVVEKILAYHPHSGDKIGAGLYSIMVDRHPEFRHSRCLFVVRTDGAWIDFSYQKCLRAYIRNKYPPEDAERFIKEHFKRT